MEPHAIERLLRVQKDFFATGATLPLAARRAALRRLLCTVEQHENEISDALYRDLGKSRSESYMCEIALVKSEIRHQLSHLGSYAREKRVHTPLAHAPAKSYVKPVPYGTVLVMSPWNYPFLLSVEPLTDALAAGNTVIVKPSAYATATSALLARLLKGCFPEKLVAVVTGGRRENTCLLDCDFDYIFFTGSQAVGKEVMRRAAEHLIPLTLELGGKSPCIVEKSADVRQAARRIVFGKFINCGQTCVAPDYILCEESIKPALLAALKREIIRQYGERPLENPDYGKIVNQKHFDRIMGLIDREKVVFGGECDRERLKIAPTVMDNVSFDDAVMGQEIFGPILPVLSFCDFRKAIREIRSRPTSLALYLFSGDSGHIRLVTEQVPFGGGCINDTLIHLATSAMGFGGLGESGMGSYHGKCGFDTFTHKKSLVRKTALPDLPLRYQPYSASHDRLIRWFVR